MLRPRVVIEERPGVCPIITEIINSKNLRVDSLISKYQIGMLIRGGWCVRRKVSSDSASRRRARSGRRIRPLSDAEITAAISEHSESVNSAPEVKDVEALGMRKNEKKAKTTE